MKVRELPQVFARVEQEVKERVNKEAKQNRRSQAAEVGLLIEQGFKWRELNQGQASA
jgi:hypothetical protein